MNGARFLQVPNPDTAAIRDTAASIGSDGGQPTVIIGRE